MVQGPAGRRLRRQGRHGGLSANRIAPEAARAARRNRDPAVWLRQRDRGQRAGRAESQRDTARRAAHVVARRRAQTAHTPSMFSHFILFALFALFALFILCERSFCLFWHPWSIGSGIRSAAWFLVDVLGLCTPESFSGARAPSTCGFFISRFLTDPHGRHTLSGGYF